MSPQLAPLARGEPVEVEPGEPRPVQLAHGMADGLEHAAHLPVAALVEDELDAARGEPLRLGRRRAAVLELDALAEAPDRVLVGIALDRGDVDLLDPVARVRDPVRELAVVREQDRAGRVRVEAADGDDADRVVDEVDDGAPSLRVARGRDDAGGLVQEDVRELLPRNRLPVDRDPVVAADVGVELAGLPVDGDAPGLDQLVGLAAGGDTGASEEGIEPHAGHCGRVLVSETGQVRRGRGGHERMRCSEAPSGPERP